jgi:hypothetical protein
MEHVFSCAFASAFILQEKKFNQKGRLLQEKKLFTTRTFLLALCRRPYPLPLLALWVFAGAMPAHAGGHRPALACRMLAPSWPCMPAAMLWVIWVIWVMVLKCKLAPVAGMLWVIWVIVF